MSIDLRSSGFLVVTGATFAAFASGFGVCLFDLGTVRECVELSRSWVGVFRDIGNHLIEWFFAIVRLTLGG